MKKVDSVRKALFMIKQDLKTETRPTRRRWLAEYGLKLNSILLSDFDR
jgi:hypothetical protein